MRVVGDKGYCSGKARRMWRWRKIAPVISTKSTERCQVDCERELSRERNEVGRLINRLKRCRSVASRYEMLAANFVAMVTIGAILIWL